MSDVVIEQTWKALVRATRQGPYAFCTFNSISDPESHHPQRAKPTISARVRRLWADTDEFALLLISQDKALQDETMSKRLQALI